VERAPDTDDDPRPADQAGEPSDLATQVGEEVENARNEVFRAYVRSRERARELGDPEG
jgi:hypothetical protein